MKVWEAEQLLLGMDPNAEVTLTIGAPRKPKKEPQPYHISPYRPQWVPNTTGDWTHPFTITCKSH